MRSRKCCRPRCGNGAASIILRNARDKLSRSTDPACLEDLKQLWGHENVGEAREVLGVWVVRWGDEKGLGRLVDWVEDHVEETLTVYRLPREHRSRMKSTNMLERYNEERRRRTRVVRIFPNAESCLRLILALAAETHERGLTGQRYLYGRVSAPTENCRKFLTQLQKKSVVRAPGAAGSGDPARTAHRRSRSVSCGDRARSQNRNPPGPGTPLAVVLGRAGAMPGPQTARTVDPLGGKGAGAVHGY